MSKNSFNNGNSIPIASLSGEELAKAIHEWSEGNHYMERILWDCINYNVETCGCCAHIPYIDFRINGSSFGRLNQLFVSAENFGNTMFYLSMCDPNPCASEQWYRESVSISYLNSNERDIFLENLSHAFYTGTIFKKSIVFSIIFLFFNFLKEKESELTVRITIKNGRYTLMLECNKNKRNMNFYPNIFKKAGMIPSPSIKAHFPIIGWEINCINNDKELEQVAKHIIEILKDNWNLELRNEFTDDMPFASEALMMRRKLGNSPGGEWLLEEWLKINKTVPRK